MLVRISRSGAFRIGVIHLCDFERLTFKLSFGAATSTIGPSLQKIPWGLMSFLPGYHVVRLRFRLQKQKLEYKEKELALRNAGQNVAEDPYMLNLRADMVFNARFIVELDEKGKNNSAIQRGVQWQVQASSHLS